MVDNNAVQVQTPPVPWLNREPVAILFVVQTGIALAMGFGLDIDSEQMALILTFTGAVLSLITRQAVTPFVATGTTPLARPAQTPNVQPPNE
jgi:hypothetical protein